jgi:hypothetical protein
LTCHSTPGEHDLLRTKEPKATFAFISPNTCLESRPDSTDPVRRINTFGTIARLSDDRTVARVVNHDRAGVELCRYADWDSERGCLAGPWDGGEDWPGFVERKSEELAITVGVLPVPQREPTEIERFCGMWPEVAKALGLRAEAPPKPLFEIGRTLSAKGVGSGELLDRHAHGDFGIYGSFDPTPLTPEQLFLIGVLAPALANSHAIQTGKGTVRSAYAVSPGRVVKIFTVLAGRDGKTLIFADRAGS